MLEGFVDLDGDRLGRAPPRTRPSAPAPGALGLVVASLLGCPWVGLGIALGLALAAINTRWVDTSVARLKNVEAKSARRPLAARTLGRLAVSTAAVLALLFLVTPMGFGAPRGLG